MADHATLRAQNDAAHHRALPFTTKADGWEEFHSENGVTTWLDRAERVIKLQGTTSKDPAHVLQFVAAHIGELRQKHSRVAVSTEVVQRFEEDKSLVIKEVNNYPNVGELTTFKYVAAWPQADGALHLVVTSPDVPQYPRGHSWLDFQLAVIRAHEGGSHVTVYVHPTTTLDLTEEQRLSVAREYSHLYTHAVTELNTA